MFKFAMVATAAFTASAFGQGNNIFDIDPATYPWMYASQGQVPNQPFNLVVELKGVDCAYAGIDAQVQFLDTQGDGRFDYAATGTVIFNLDHWHETGDLMDPSQPLSIQAHNIISWAMMVTQIPQFENFHLDGAIEFMSMNDVIVPHDPFSPVQPSHNFPVRGTIEKEEISWGNCPPPTCQLEGPCYDSGVDWTVEDFKWLWDKIYKDDFFEDSLGRAVYAPRKFRTSTFVVPQGTAIRTYGAATYENLGPLNNYIRDKDDNSCYSSNWNAHEVYELIEVTYGPLTLKDIAAEKFNYNSDVPPGSCALAACSETILHVSRRSRGMGGGLLRPVLIPYLGLKCLENAVAATYPVYFDQSGYVTLDFPCSPVGGGQEIDGYTGDVVLKFTGYNEAFNDTYVFPSNGSAFVWDPQNDSIFNFDENEPGWDTYDGGINIKGFVRYDCDTLDDAATDEQKAAWEQAVCTTLSHSMRRCTWCEQSIFWDLPIECD